jgi:hypothetical protein
MSRQILLGALLLSFDMPESFLKAKERTKVVVAFFFPLPTGVVDVRLDIFLYGELNVGI